MISFSKKFQTSVNISYDFDNAEKIENFIPTIQGIQFIEETILSASNISENKNTNRAKILIGAYGKGKSYIVLETLSLLYNNPDLQDSLKKIVEKIAISNPFAAENISNYLKSKKRLLPIIINGNSSSLSQSFLYALNLTLKKNEFKNLMPETHFESAAKMIEKWEKDFPETLNKFNSLASVKSSKFKEKLRNFDSQIFDEFEKLYPILTSGSEFNPFFGFDFIEVFEKVNEKICQTGKYDGIFVVYDEFGKYLESSISTATIKDVKFLQDFAERAERSKENQNGKNQLHLLLICHKEIENYIDVLPKQKVDGWKGVSERFMHIRLFNTYLESYNLISAAIIKEKSKYEKFVNIHKNQFENLQNIWFENSFRIFSEIKNDENLKNLIVFGCYPLHPVTSYILPRLSEKVAQNERTLFTFLSGNEKNALPNLCKNLNFENENLKLFTPDVLFDYFENQMQNEVYTSEIKKNYLSAKSALSVIKNANSKNEKIDKKTNLELKIIKTISLIYSLNQFERLSPDLNFIFALYLDAGFSKEEIREAIKNLTEKFNVLYLNIHNNYFQLKTNSNFDISKLILETIEKRKKSFNAIKILNEFNTEKYLYPSEYNVKNKMTRFFKFEFINENDFSKLNFHENFADGFIFAIFNEKNDSELENLKEKCKEISTKNNDFVFILPKIKNKNIESVLQKFDAVVSLKKSFENDILVFDELEIIYKDLFEVLKQTVRFYIQPEENKSIYITDGKEKKLYRKADLSKLLSEKCNLIFEKTPIINNEMLNKNNLTGASQKTRAKLLDSILSSSLEKFNFSGNAQEVSFLRSAFIVPGILSDNSIQQKFNFEPKTNNQKNDDAFKNLFKIINDFVKKAEQNEISFDELLEKLVNPKYKIGLRFGVIPLYIAAVLRSYSKNCVLKKEKTEISLTSQSLCEIVQNPENFSLKIEKWTDEKSAYIENLENIFSDFVIDDEKTIYSGYLYILNAMNRWQRSLSKYAKSLKQKPHSKFLEILREETYGTQEILFEKIPKVYDFISIEKSIVEKIKETKLFFDNAILKLKKDILENTISEFTNFLIDKMIKIQETNSLKNLISDFYKNISLETKNHIFENDAHSLLKIYKLVVENNEQDEIKIIEEMAKVLTGLSFEDWGVETEKIYFLRLKDLHKSIEDFELEKKSLQNEKTNFEEKNTTNNYTVYFANEIEKKSFNKVECSSRAKNLEKEIYRTFEEVGQSVSEAEKRQILLNLLEKLC